MERFDAEFLRRLEALRLALRRRAPGAREGERPSGRPGGAGLFQSHRGYAQGDDFRAIDWQVYARLGELFVREREREQAARLHVVLDASPSMRLGGKLEFARRLAAALGLIAEAEGGEAILWCGRSRPLSLATLETVSEGPPASVSLRSVPARSLAIVLTDPWDELALWAPCTLVHVLAREELEPSARGMIRVVDSETGASVVRYVGDEEIATYRDRLRDWFDKSRERAHRHEVAYVRCAADERLESVLRLFIGEGVVE